MTALGELSLPMDFQGDEIFPNIRSGRIQDAARPQ